MSIDWLKGERPMRLMREAFRTDGRFQRTFDLLIVDEAAVVRWDWCSKCGAIVLTYLNDNLAMRIQAETFENLLRSALLLGSLVGFGAFAVAAIDRVAARRAELTALTIAGVPRRILRYAQAVQTALPLFVGLAAAFALGKLAEQATVVVSGVISEWSWDGLGLSLLIGLICACAVVLGTVVAIPSRIDPGLIRRE